MKIFDVISFVDKHLVQYAETFVRTLGHPIMSFQPLQTTSIDDVPRTQDATSSPGSWRRLMVFVFISLCIGTIINLGVPARKYSFDIVGKIGVLSFFYLDVVAYTHVLCRIVRGKADSTQTLWVSLQVLASLFVVASVINLVGGVIVMHPRVSSFLVSTGRLGNSIANNPVYIYFPVHYALLNIYLPLAVKEINGFGWIRTGALIVGLSMFWVLFGVVFYSDLRYRFVDLL